MRKDTLTAERERIAGLLAVEGANPDKLKTTLRAKARHVSAVLRRGIPQARRMLLTASVILPAWSSEL